MNAECTKPRSANGTPRSVRARSQHSWAGPEAWKRSTIALPALKGSGGWIKSNELPATIRGRKFDGQALMANVPGDAEATLSLAFTFSLRTQVLQCPLLSLTFPRR